MTDDNSRRDQEVIPSLMDLLTEAMEPVKDQKGRVKALEDLGRLAKVSDRQVRRYFNDESGLPVDDLDRLVAAVAVETGNNRMRMWRRAVEQAEREINSAGVDHWEEAMKTARAARLPEHD